MVVYHVYYGNCALVNEPMMDLYPICRAMIALLDIYKDTLAVVNLESSSGCFHPSGYLILEHGKMKIWIQ